MVSQFSQNQSSQNLTVRRATAADADWAVPLLFATGPGLFSYIFAAPPAQAQEILQQAFVLPQHAFSYEHTHIVEAGDRYAGLIIGYPSSIKKVADEKVHFAMARVIPLRKLPKILVNVADFSRIKQEVSPTDYYILGLTVAPEFRQQGIASQLLDWAEWQAEEHGCTHICADITYTNAIAFRLFEQWGYHLVCSKTTERFAQMTNSGGIHRVRKAIDLEE